jgi:DNA-binding NtrC family response regulator
MSQTSLLLVDDDRHVLDSMSGWLRSRGYRVDTARDRQAACELVDRNQYDLVLCDIRLGNSEDGFAVLAHCREKKANATVILITGYATMETGIEALRAGAFDLLTKPLLDDELEMSINRALAQRQVLQENRQLKAQLDSQYGLEHIIGHDQRMKRIFDMIDSVADTRATVLISGESGTGKSLIARAIHRRSDRRDGPFVEVACGALPENLLESELFGHAAGAFTGAIGEKDGKFKQADGGTIFLDEIGTAPMSMQVKLLRVLQEFQFEKVGGNKTFTVDSRVVLATNEDLSRAVDEGRFRQDLYYRVNVINIQLPSLRERASDIPLLARHFLQQVCEDANRPVPSFSPEALQVIQRYGWPGNVRELQNVIERAVLLGKGNAIGVEDLNLGIGSTPIMPVASAAGCSLKAALEGPERAIILEVLESHNWNRNATADSLGINRTTLYKKMKRLGLEDPIPSRAAQYGY